MTPEEPLSFVQMAAVPDKAPGAILCRPNRQPQADLCQLGGNGFSAALAE